MPTTSFCAHRWHESPGGNQTFAYRLNRKPFEAPRGFDINLALKIIESQTMEAGNELWLLQTDSDSFYHYLEYHDAHWFGHDPKLQKFWPGGDFKESRTVAFKATIEVMQKARS